jgi:hypothetical protein
MQVQATFASGHNGAKQLLKQFGYRFQSDRYLYDKVPQNRLKDIEIIADDHDWISIATFSADMSVPLKMGFGESGFRYLMKRAGAFWNLDKNAMETKIQIAKKGQAQDRLICVKNSNLIKALTSSLLSSWNL